MTQAELFVATMEQFWYDSDQERVELKLSKESFAIMSHVKTHRVNGENAFEVLAIMWPDATVNLRKDADAGQDDWDKQESHHDVTFSDSSQALVVAKKGIGNSVA